jgi:phage terminase large subunit GpA-like protein
VIHLPLRSRNALLEESAALFANARTRRRRTRRQFAEQEITIPTGPHKDKKFRCHRQPFAGHLFDAIDSGRFNEVAVTGPSQSGKSLAGFVVPILYHIFEFNETTICGVPDIDMAGDKWREDILPVIEGTRYKDFLPTSGSGSRGGMVEAIKFKHGPTLKFMGGGGNDKTRAGFTARVLVITEVDGLDTAGATSREADKVKQLEARLRSYGSRRMIYKECTCSVETGHIWQQYSKFGTNSRLLLPCPHCRQFVLPEREHLVGWEGAADLVAAREAAAFACPECGEVWSEEERKEANHAARLVHEGQEIDAAGEIQGTAKPTPILGFRWSAVHNLFATAADFAEGEWKAKRASDQSSAEKEQRQFVFCIPVESEIEELTPLDPQTIPYRLLKGVGRQLFPLAGRQFTVGVDVNSRFVHWCALAWLDEQRPHVVDYGEIPLDRTQSLEIGLLTALATLFARLERGFPWEQHDQPRVPDQVWVDSSWESGKIYTAVLRANAVASDPHRYRPIKGYGAGQERQLHYRKPTKTSSTVLAIGDRYHFALQPDSGVVLVEIDANHWKSYLRSRLEVKVDDLAGAPLTLFDDVPTTHLEIAQHWTAEEPRQEYVPGKGIITYWFRKHRQNHQLDTTYTACTAGDWCGARLPSLAVTRDVPQPDPAPPPLLSLTGQPFFALDR